MIELKYASPQIKKLPELVTWGKALLVKIHVITGWTIPADTDILTVLIDQFCKKLMEDYSELNVDEVEYAFRSTGTTVKDWGKSMNLALIDEVLRPYVNNRFEISQKEEQKHEPEQKIYTAEELDNIHRSDVEYFYQRSIKCGLQASNIPEYFLSILIKDGIVAPETNDLEAFFEYCINSGRKNIYVRQ